MAYFRKFSPFLAMGIKSFNQGNHSLKNGRFKHAIKSYKKSASDIIWAKRNWPHNTWPEKYFLVNHRHKFLYCPIPKVACSSIKESFLKLANVEDLDTVLETRGLIHRYMQQKFSLATCTQSHAKAILTQDHYFKFIVVRNPWSRVVSAYLDKFVHHLNLEEEPFVQQVIDKIYSLRELNPDYEKGITFRQFLDYINITDDDELNSHWKPQYLFFGETEFDFIGKFETLGHDFEYISNQINIPFDLPWSHRAKNKSTLDHKHDYSNYYASELRQMEFSPTYQHFYPPDLKTLFHERYRNDITQFDYHFDPP